MALVPKLFYYSPSKNIEIDIVKEKIIQKSNQEMVLESDGSKVVFAFKVEESFKICKYRRFGKNNQKDQKD